MTGGARVAVREGRGERGWAGSGELGRLASRPWPKWAPGLFLLFFSFCYVFLLF
jgi:hypothetical protein